MIDENGILLEGVDADDVQRMIDTGELQLKDPGQIVVVHQQVSQRAKYPSTAKLLGKWDTRFSPAGVSAVARGCGTRRSRVLARLLRATAAQHAGGNRGSGAIRRARDGGDHRRQSVSVD